MNKINEKVGHHIQLFLCPPEIDFKKLSYKKVFFQYMQSLSSDISDLYNLQGYMVGIGTPTELLEGTEHFW